MDKENKSGNNSLQLNAYSSTKSPHVEVQFSPDGDEVVLELSDLPVQPAKTSEDGGDA